MAKIENRPESKYRFSKSRVAAGVAAIALSLTGCSSAGKKPSAAQALPSSSGSSQPVELTPDLSGFLKPGSNTTCFNGGPRPCALLIRTMPELSADYVNTSPSQEYVSWPLEAYGGTQGNSVPVRCYTTDGQIIRPYEGDTSSTDWYQVIVPEQYVQNPAVRSELSQTSSTIGTIQYGGRTAVLGWASIEWFDESTPDPAVPRC